MAFLRFSVLAFRVLLWVLLASLVVFVLASGSGVMHERQRALEAAHQDVVEAVNQSLPTISVSLWQYDTAGLNTLVRGLVLTDSLVRVEIGDHRGVLAQANQAGKPMDPPRGPVWTIPVKAPETGKEIGFVRVHESYELVEARLRESVGMLVLIELVKIGGLAIILFVIVYRKVARHLHDLAADVSRLDPGDEAPQVEVRRTKLGQYKDEFDILVDAINRFLIERAEETGRRTAAEERLRQRVSEVETMLGALSDGVLALDRSRRVRFANAAACKLLGLNDAPADVGIGQLLSVTDSIGDNLGDLFGNVIERREATHFRGNVMIRPAGAAPFEAKISGVPVPDSGDVAMIFVFTDISAEIAKERKIEFQAYHDPLTRLGNRSMLARDLQLDISSALQSGRKVAVLCLDLDNFKNINDALGHMIGDIMLRELADRFREAVQAPGWVTRHGGDEFIVVLPQLDDVESAVVVAQRLMDGIAEPFEIEGHQLRVTSSIGISLAPDHGSSIVQLVSCADMAMYAAKNDGKNAWRVFEEGLLKRSTERLAMENGLRVAILEKQFTLAFQPKLDLRTGRVDTVEALIRWHRPDHGWVPPVAFIPVAEDCGLINEIGTWVAQEACAAARRIRAALGRDIAVAINVSPVQFRGDALMSVLTALAQANPDLRGLIEVELTESALSGEIGEVVAKLEAMRLLGLRIAIDDFGTGYSSLTYLKNLPVDILKIDQAFIRGLPDSAQDQAIVDAVVQLGHSFGFAIVAEGVEESLHAEYVRRIGCEYAQGYWFARPMAEPELLAFLGDPGAHVP